MALVVVVAVVALFVVGGIKISLCLRLAPPGITFSIVNRSRPTRCPQANISAPGIVRFIFLSD